MVSPQKNNNKKTNKKKQKQNKIELPYDPWVYIKTIEIRPQRVLYSHLNAALLTIAEIWKQSKCQSLHERVKKMWHMYKIKY